MNQNQQEIAKNKIAPSKKEFNFVFDQWKLKCSEFGSQKYKAENGNLLLKTLFNMWVESFNSVSGIEDYRDKVVQLLTISSKDPAKYEKYKGWDTRIYKLFDSQLIEKSVGNDLDKIKQKEFAKEILEIPMFGPYDPYVEAWVRHFYTKEIPYKNERHRELSIRQKILKAHQMYTPEYGEYDRHAGLLSDYDQLKKEQWYIECIANEKNHAEPDWFAICRLTYPELFIGNEI